MDIRKIIQQKNHPKKGSRIKVDPIRRISHVKSISKYLTDKPRDQLLFIMGVNNGLRSGDLLRLKVNQIKDLKSGEYLEIKEGKTGKENILVINKAVYKAIRNYMEKLKPNDDDYLFKGQRGQLRPETIHAMVKSWCRVIKLKGNYGSHTLRKTWGYHQRVTFGVDLPRLMVCFNHATQRQTLDYLCVQPEEIKDVYENEL